MAGGDLGSELAGTARRYIVPSSRNDPSLRRNSEAQGLSRDQRCQLPNRATQSRWHHRRESKADSLLVGVAIRIRPLCLATCAVGSRRRRSCCSTKLSCLDRENTKARSDERLYLAGGCDRPCHRTDQEGPTRRSSPRSRRRQRNGLPADLELPSYRQCHPHSKNDLYNQLKGVSESSDLHSSTTFGALTMKKKQTAWRDPIVEEIHRFREEYAKKFDYNLDRMFEDLRRRQEEDPGPVVSFARTTSTAANLPTVPARPSKRRDT